MLLKFAKQCYVIIFYKNASFINMLSRTESLHVYPNKYSTYILTLVLLNCFNYIFRHLKLEWLTQFPASNDEKYYYLWQIDMFKIKLLDQQSIY